MVTTEKGWGNERERRQRLSEVGEGGGGEKWDETGEREREMGQ